MWRPGRAVMRTACLFGIACVAVGIATAAPLEDVITRVKPSIVAIGTYQESRNPRFVFRGTGFIVGEGRLVATNAHVLPADLDTSKSESMAVVLPAVDGGDHQRRQATVAKIDKEHDLAVLRMSGPPLPALRISQSGTAREGQSTAFTGFPIGSALGLIPVTHRATVSAITPIALPPATAAQLDVPLVRQLKAGSFEVLQLDATAYPGNSGSPLYDSGTGEVIGIINMVFVKTTKEAVLSQPSGITFAVPTRYLQALVSSVN